MTRSYVLLHCPSAKIRTAHEEAWEGKDPGSVRVLLSNPRWERRLLRFVVDEEEARPPTGWCELHIPMV
jgi:hypothetical protein